jgi:hypothetical protein
MEFESRTQFITLDIIVPMRVRISKVKTFELIINPPYSASVLANLEDFTINKPDIGILNIFKLFLLKSIFNAEFVSNFDKHYYVSLRKYLSSITRLSHLIRVKRSGIKSGIKLNSVNRPVIIKTAIRRALYTKRLTYYRYGIFANFANLNGARYSLLKKFIGVLHLTLFKVKADLTSSIFDGKYFVGNNIFYIGADNFSKFSFF